MSKRAPHYMRGVEVSESEPRPDHRAPVGTRQGEARQSIVTGQQTVGLAWTCPSSWRHSLAWSAPVRRCFSFDCKVASCTIIELTACAVNDRREQASVIQCVPCRGCLSVLTLTKRVVVERQQDESTCQTSTAPPLPARVGLLDYNAWDDSALFTLKHDIKRHCLVLAMTVE